MADDPVSAEDVRGEVSALIESHLSQGITCACGKWKIDTTNRPIDPRRQHRDHVAILLAEYVATKQAAALREVADWALGNALDVVSTHYLRARADRYANPEAGA